MANDLFSQINNAILDLQASEYQTYDRPLKTLARLLQHPDLAAANKSLTDGLDLDAFLESQERGGGIVGSDRLEWPDDPNRALGLTFLLILRFAENPDFIVELGHTYFDSGSKLMAGVNAITRQLVIPFARDYKSYVISCGDNSPRLVTTESNKVFIVHGHDEGALHGLARFLEKLGLEAIVLKEQPNQGRTIIEKYEDYAKEVGFAVVLLTPDDLASSASETDQNKRARQNVIFELGYFAGRLGRGRVCLLRKGDVEMPSDLFGVIYTEMDSTEGWKTKLVLELKAAKLTFDANRMWAA
ncbi:nucleotide-binding protein [Mesorhizobium sp. B2-6-4]|uniref:TIR domain-containing protein n=1 Tax=Mesorhizobium sp. B2-6-4 TaxID=2589913 RepID=UPI00112C648F|nr:nucleotide-binding protein [Mesorhizobium sp. B2-6-4]TPJ52379.1 hypothetical protein FJ426_16750 [Mesorhizobium sp. B2-6-4]